MKKHKGYWVMVGLMYVATFIVYTGMAFLMTLSFSKPMQEYWVPIVTGGLFVAGICTLCGVVFAGRG